MKICLLHPPHGAIGSRIPRENLPPLGLLAIGGPLIDDGHAVELLNADLEPMSDAAILAAVLDRAPDAILIGHSGSSSAHPTVARLVPLLRATLPRVWIVYGGVYPSYHWREVLEELPEVDVIVRGEGEEICRRLMARLGAGRRCTDLAGIAFRGPTGPLATAPAPMIADLDAYRIGWELIDHDDYSYWGGKKAVVLQFSRGCPHLCSYCGQRGFWTRWRHRDPEAFAREIGRLVREEGVELVNLADENPTSSRRLWRRFLEALIAEKVEVLIIGSTRAGDIVRDADILPLYRQAGVLRFLLGLESTDAETLARIRKGSTPSVDRRAIALMRANGMIALCTWAVGFAEERDRDYLRLLRQLLTYDPDQILSVNVTPHRWTPFYGDSRDRRVIQADRSLWDYKHQVLATRHLPPWRVFLWVKLIEMSLQLRPKALWRNYLHPDPRVRHAMRWYSAMGRRVFLHEVWSFWFRERRLKKGPRVACFWGGETQLEESAHAPRLPRGRTEQVPGASNACTTPDPGTARALPDRGRLH